MMKKQTLLSLLLLLVCMMWASSVSAGVSIRWNYYETTGYITGEGITGSVHYDAENKVLTLDNAHITFDKAVLINGDEGLKLVVKGDCSLTCEGFGYITISSSDPMTITGGGTLTLVHRGTAFSNESSNKTMTLTIEDCTVVTKGGDYGFYGNKASTLVIRNATVKVGETKYSSIEEWGNIKLEGCKIEQPADATFGENKWGKYLMKDGKIVTSEVVIVPDGTGVASLTTDVPTPHERCLYLRRGLSRHPR